MIAIPNMEKPKECQVCPIFIWCYTNDWKGYEHCPLIEIPQEDEEAVLFIVRMRKAMREGKSLREFIGGEMANNTRTE